MLENATVIDEEIDKNEYDPLNSSTITYYGTSPEPNEIFIRGTFKARFRSQVNSKASFPNKQFTIDMKEPQSIHTVFILTGCDAGYDETVSEIGIWIGDEQKDSGEDLQDYARAKRIRNTGFFKLDQIRTGRYLVIRRDASNFVYPDITLSLFHLLVFETPNLLQVIEEGVAQITNDTTQVAYAVEPFFEYPEAGSSSSNGITNRQQAINLLNNLDQRKCKNDLQPIKESVSIDQLKTWIGTDNAFDQNIRSCYTATQDILSKKGHILVLGVDLKDSYFIHILLLV